ncbi:TonB-linked outer membrane protein, SusC/RagA family [Mesonia phycicola]|uniref:TonB-linked outer membrane protein, SusC/RagA family n=1 Tax=Mesonia phycicola TaxID=579105 RepID=A0A1M6AYZ8_9FLAO|nr:TonB-dependent receptor [Mesonia phycicola]SHI41686.1 TonB-linked outer membrane protein, SusC/RagA family [Mesonia phycicola]
MRTKFSGILTLLLAFVVQVTFAQEKTVSGTVTDDEGLPLPGVNVIIEGSSSGTQSDFDGNYSISTEVGQKITFSYVGFEPQSITVGSSNTYNITFKQASELDEVIVTAYKTTTKRKSSAAVTTISAESLEDRPNASLVQSIQGQVAGLNISTSSGQPGANSVVILRGVGSINGNVEPLFILDGVPVDEDNFRSINPNDIASVSVLKDASATSIYGNRGANGVIIITTKSGKFNDKMTIRYSAQYGVSELQDLNIDLMNSREKLYFQKSLGQGTGAGLSDAEIDALASSTNTYWQDVFFRTGTTNSQNLSISSGSENTTNLTSLGYFKQEGTYIASDLQRFSFRNKFTGKSSDNKFHYTANINANFSQSNFDDGEGSRSIYFNPYMAALQSLPFLSPYDSDGNTTTTGGIAYGDITGITADLAPYVLLNSAALNTNRDEEIKVIGSLSADYSFAKGWMVKNTFGVDYTSVSNNEILHPNSILGPFQANASADFGGLERNSIYRDARFTNTFNVGYNTTIDKHSIGVNAYTEYIKSHYWSIGYEQRGLDPKSVGTGAAFVDGNISEVLDDGTEITPYVPTLSKTNLETGLFSYFATVTYDYDDKYGFDASIRRDASSRFIDENKWGTFYSVSGRWNIDQESFMENTAFNLLKLRASYGTAGNDRILGGYYSGLNLTQNLYTFTDSYNSSSAYVPSVIANTTLQWETTAQFNVGIDYALWNNKLSGNLDVYEKKTTDLFQSSPISLINGTGDIDSNIGSMRNRGVEAFVKYNIFQNEDWSFSVSANASYNKNEILELAGADENGVIFEGGATALGEGEAFGSFYTVEYAGVNPANGNPLFVDANGDLTETLQDADRKFSDKSIYPVWSGGFGAQVSYKSFYLSNQWVWFADIYRNNLDLADLESNSNITDRNSAASLLNAWTQPGDITSIPRMNGQYSGVDYLNTSDRYVEDVSYLRLRNIQLGYTFTPEILKNTPFSNVNIYVQGENLLTFSKWQGWDPDGGFAQTASSAYPTPKIYTFGLNVKF